MTKKETKYFSTAMLVNGLQLLLCFIIYIVGLIMSVNNVVIAIIMLIAQVLIWLICGFKVAVSGDMDKFGKVLLGVIIALFPIVLYTAISYCVSRFVAIDSQSWTHFFFLGGPLIFFNKPITLLMGLFKGNGYLLFIVNYAIIGISYLIGELFGYAINGGKRRKNKKIELNKEENTENNQNKKDKKTKSKKDKNKKRKKKKNVETDIDEANEDIEQEIAYNEDELKEISEKQENNAPLEDMENTMIDKETEEKEDKMAEEIVNNILKENLMEQKNIEKEDK